MIKIKFHSIVDVITNSSTVIYTYQNSTEQAKELIDEVLKLSCSDLKAVDIFHFGEFIDEDYYLNSDNLPDTCPDDYELQSKWIADLQSSIMKGAIKRPEWMEELEDELRNDYYPDIYLHIIVQNEKYNDLATKIQSLLSSVSADGGRDG